MTTTQKLIMALILIAAAGPAGIAAASEPPAGDARRLLWGTHLLAGGRYDDVRMFVGSPPGVPGGPIMDVYLDIRIPVGERSRLAINLPLLRPILFGIAFDMLQFEPQMTWETSFPTGGRAVFVLGGGLGAVFHYGPDYRSDPDAPGPAFFAAGPLFSVSGGLEMTGKNGGTWMPGLKVFYAPLFSAVDGPGTVAGGALELHYIFGG